MGGDLSQKAVMKRKKTAMAMMQGRSQNWDQGLEKEERRGLVRELMRAVKSVTA